LQQVRTIGHYENFCIYNMTSVFAQNKKCPVLTSRLLQGSAATMLSMVESAVTFVVKFPAK